MECTDCQAGAQCTNRALQSLRSPPLTFSGGNLTVTTNLEAGAVLGQFTGEVITREALQTRLVEEYAQQDFTLYVYPLTEQLVVDATSKGSVIRLDLTDNNSVTRFLTSNPQVCRPLLFSQRRDLGVESSRPGLSRSDGQEEDPGRGDSQPRPQSSHEGKSGLSRLPPC